MTEVRPFSSTEKLAAVERELRFRRQVYPQRILAGKMTKRLADEQIALFEQIASDYRPQAQKERLL